MSTFRVYTGKEGNTTEHSLGAINCYYTSTKDLHNSYRHVNYFSGVDLLLGLLRNGLWGRGTLRANRKGIPSKLEEIVNNK